MLQILFFAAFALVPAAFLLGLMRTRFFRTAAVGRVIERLTHDPRGVRDALAAELGDPALTVAYWLPERGYVDREGRPLPDPGDGRVRDRDRARGPRVGALMHDAVLCETPELLLEPRRRPRWRSRTRGWRSSCGRGWRRCARRARGWSRRATPSAGGSAATFTTARSSGWWR